IEVVAINPSTFHWLQYNSHRISDWVSSGSASMSVSTITLMFLTACAASGSYQHIASTSIPARDNLFILAVWHTFLICKQHRARMSSQDGRRIPLGNPLIQRTVHRPGLPFPGHD